MSASTNLLIEVRGLQHTYLPGTPLETQSLFGVDLEVHAGESVGIIGPTGSGKSTLLQHLNGLLRPQQGGVWVEGVSLADPQANLRSVRQKVGLVFQNPEDQLFERYAGDDVAFGPRNLGLPPAQVRELVRQAMQVVALPFEFKDRLTLELSQGQRRRLALAGVLALAPRVLVLDEPTAGLDPQGRQELLHALCAWRSHYGRAIVLASHNMEDVAELADRVFVLVAGRIVLSGPPRQVFAQPELLGSDGLWLPSPTQALQELRRLGYPVSSEVLTVAEAAAQIEALFHA